MRYEAYEYLWPPRPEKAVPKAMLKFYEGRGWWATAKKNGTCNVLGVRPDRTLHCMNRHNQTHKLWSPTPASSAAFKRLPGRGWYVFVAELLHSKVEGLRDINYIHDILVVDGTYLIETSYAERQGMLAKLFLTGRERETDTHYVINENTWLVKNHRADFISLFDGLGDEAEDEGIVVKNPKARLSFCSRQSANSEWQVKCRRPHKNYSF